MNTTIERPAAPPVLPSVPPAPVRERKTAIALGVLAALLLGYVIWVVTSDWVPAPTNEPSEPAVFEEGAPAGDFFIPIEAIGRSGVREQDMLIDRLGPQGNDGMTVVQDSIVHEANAVSPTKGSVNLYRWQAIAADKSVTDCYGEFLENGSGSNGTCGPLEIDQPNLGWGLDQSGPTTNNVSVWNAPESARWMLVTSYSGQVVVSPVVNLVTYSEWSGDNNGPVQVQLLDATFDQVWMQTIN